MTRRVKKRKTDHSKENVSPPKKRMNREEIVLTEKNWMPIAATNFYESEQFEELENNLKLVDESVVFVGPFRRLREKSDVNGVELIMLDREENDLPEMQTFMKCALGRYAIWRDTPAEENPVIVFVDLQTVPDVSVIGDKVEHAVHNFCMRLSKYQDNSTKVKAAISTILDILGDNKTKDEISRVIRNRKRETVLGIVGPGLLVGSFPNGRSRYRDLGNDHQTPNIESLLRCLNKVGIKEQSRVVSLIDSLMNDVMVYNEEGFYANGLELGHVLFLANQQTIHNQVQMILKVAYDLLNRSDFFIILNLTLELRDH